MVNRTTAINQIIKLVKALVQAGYQPTKVYLFGSVATGQQHEHSDIDVAIWDEHFTSCLTIDYEPIKHILSQFPLIELHTFSTADDETNHPWAREVIQQGIPINWQKAVATT
ncbi:MAG: nucleotidyltransferase domain-containing protein [Saprospiraceae bacterium]|nr:nucleotidyltransferase domain-containing protein [Saprospiraceae bacterium]